MDWLALFKDGETIVVSWRQVNDRTLYRMK